MVSKNYYSMNRDHYLQYQKTFIIKVKKNLKNILELDIITCPLMKS